METPHQLFFRLSIIEQKSVCRRCMLAVRLSPRIDSPLFRRRRDSPLFSFAFGGFRMYEHALEYVGQIVYSIPRAFAFRARVDT